MREKSPLDAAFALSVSLARISATGTSAGMATKSLHVSARFRMEAPGDVGRHLLGPTSWPTTCGVRQAGSA